MKNYLDYILETVDIEGFDKDYEVISDKLEHFWSTLSEKLTVADSKTQRDPDTVLQENKQLREERSNKQKPDSIPIKDKVYKYELNGKVLNVKILKPDLGNKTAQVFANGAPFPSPWTNLSGPINEPVSVKQPV
jgi:hypothetical protein